MRTCLKCVRQGYSRSVQPTAQDNIMMGLDLRPHHWHVSARVSTSTHSRRSDAHDHYKG